MIRTLITILALTSVSALAMSTSRTTLVRMVEDSEAIVVATATTNSFRGNLLYQIDIVDSKHHSRLPAYCAPFAISQESYTNALAYIENMRDACRNRGDDAALLLSLALQRYQYESISHLTVSRVLKGNTSTNLTVKLMHPYVAEAPLQMSKGEQYILFLRSNDIGEWILESEAYALPVTEEYLSVGLMVSPLTKANATLRDRESSSRMTYEELIRKIRQMADQEKAEPTKASTTTNQPALHTE
jgi:hypothetical protein